MDLKEQDYYQATFFNNKIILGLYSANHVEWELLMNVWKDILSFGEKEYGRFWQQEISNDHVIIFQHSSAKPNYRIIRTFERGKLDRHIVYEVIMEFLNKYFDIVLGISKENE